MVVHLTGSMGKNSTLVHNLTLELTPILMIIGLIMSIGASFFIPPTVLILTSLSVVAFWILNQKTYDVASGDLRFLIVPVAIFATGALTFYHLLPAFYDQAYHLQISNRILDRWDWEPTHQGMSYSFRPEIVSGIAAVELFFTGSANRVLYTPTLILLGCCYSIQHLAERYSSKNFGFISAVIFCFFPVVVTFGRTMMLDVAVTGMIISVIHHTIIRLELEDSSVFLLLGTLSAVVGLTKYPYLYFGGMIAVVLLFNKKYQQAKKMLLGYLGILLLFFIKNWIHTGSVIGPMKSQVTGTIASVEAISTDTVTYTSELFIYQFLSEWPIILLCVAVYGTALIAKRNKEFLMYSWMVILPAILLHGYILNFGWVRYSVPWLALLCIGIPSAIYLSNLEFGTKIETSRIPSLIIICLLLGSVSPMLSSVEETRDLSEHFYDSRHAWVEIYEQLGTDLDDDAVIITGRDINVGLHSQTESYRPEDQNYPFLQAINKFDATHVFTQDVKYRFDIDVNEMLLFATPIEPVSSISVESNTGRLWAVDENRLETADFWRNHSLDFGTGTSRMGDFVWIQPSASFQIPENIVISRIVETDSGLDLTTIFDAITLENSNLLCSDVESCQEFQRDDWLSQGWAVWLQHE